ncbi:hypothetical protein MtrunA17_Chr1g0150421 [Medicago truncatula]|uniref:Aminotransferase-like plant mobile domain-containing protein n=1 Tax=Medicago truncatula TaxID=3880 RepID=A0A396JFJ8_MEDTR|nr:hypothetical protein MtrunA17_Chr1g0150421 [Medicago truncatula]
MTLLVGWVLARFRNLIPRNHNDECDLALAPLVDQWKPPSGFSDPGHHSDANDSLEHSHVIWRPYERRRDMAPFQDIFWYSGWIMAGRDRMVRHLPERVLRQYMYVQTGPRAPTDIGPLVPEEVAMTFMEFSLHVLSQQERVI